MKINKIIAILALSATVVSCNKQLKTTSSLTSEIDSVSYALGMNMAQQFKINAKEINGDLFVQGYLNGKDSANLLIASKDVQKTINTYFQKKRQEQMLKQQEEQKAKAEKEFGEYKKENEQFLADNKSKKGVKTTASGLQYIVLKEGKGDAPKLTDQIKIHYAGKTIKGEEFDSSYKRNKPYEARPNQFVKGFTEGLLLMKKGAKYRLFIPQELAYGVQQRGQLIKPFSTLVFDVEMLDVKKK